MLEGNDHIPRFEHRSFFALASLLLLVRVVQFIQLLIATFFPEPPPPGITLSRGLIWVFDDPAFVGPIHSFLVFACVTMLWRLTKLRLIIAALFLTPLAWFFSSWFLDSQRMIAFAKSVQSEGGLIDHNPVLVGGTYYDVFTLVTVDVLMIWIVITVLRLVLPLRFR